MKADSPALKRNSGFQITFDTVDRNLESPSFLVTNA
jgi:hypothetical protein